MPTPDLPLVAPPGLQYLLDPPASLPPGWVTLLLDLAGELLALLGG